MNKSKTSLANCPIGAIELEVVVSRACRPCPKGEMLDEANEYMVTPNPTGLANCPNCGKSLSPPENRGIVGANYKNPLKLAAHKVMQALGIRRTASWISA